MRAEEGEPGNEARGMQPLVPLVFHNLPSLYPPSFRRNDFLYLFHPFLTVQNAPSKTMLEYRCKKRDVDTSLCSTRGSNSDRTIDGLIGCALRICESQCVLHNWCFLSVTGTFIVCSAVMVLASFKLEAFVSHLLTHFTASQLSMP